jgi:hypothetical protein
MTPTSKTWLFGRAPVISFALTALVWLVYIAHSIANRPPYPTYPYIGGALALLCYTIAGGILAFLLSACGLRSSAVPKAWAWTGLLLNAPIALYLVGYYPAVFVYRLFAKP